MCKACWHKELLEAVGSEVCAGPLSECRGPPPNIDSHIEDHAVENANQLGLRPSDLSMQSTKRSLLGEACIVLYKGVRDTGFSPSILVVALKEIAPLVTKYMRCEKQDFGNRQRRDLGKGHGQSSLARVGFLEFMWTQKESDCRKSTII